MNDILLRNITSVYETSGIIWDVYSANTTLMIDNLYLENIVSPDNSKGIVFIEHKTSMCLNCYIKNITLKSN